MQQGNATWYEDNSPNLYASHARFPPGTRLRVTNLNNQREVYVTVTDRIQNSSNRILDISQEAASLLGMNKRGSTPIRLVVIRGPVPDDRPVPEITAVTISPDNGEDDGSQDYENYNKDDFDEIPPAVTVSAETPPSPPPPIRTFPKQPAPQPQAETQVLLKKLVVIINGREQTIDIPDGVYIPFPVSESAPSTPPAYPPSAYTPPPQRIYVPAAPQLPPPSRPISAPPPVQAANSAIKIIPKLPDPQSGKVYRVQVGAFSRVALAQLCFDRLKSAGFTPAFEKNGSLYRVVISGIKAADVSYAAQRLNNAGFREAWIREESRP